MLESKHEIPVSDDDGAQPSRPGSSATLRYAAADRAILSIASRQHGVVTRAQLMAAGVPASVLDRRLSLNTLRRLHRGVYLASPIESSRARARAAVFACGSDRAGSPVTRSPRAEALNINTGGSLPDGPAAAAIGETAHTGVTPGKAGEAPAVVSHWTALHLFGLGRRGGHAPTVHVTVVGRGTRRPGIRVHRVARLPSDEVTTVDGIPVTNPARTLLDLGAAMSLRDLEHAVVEALGKRLTTPDALGEILSRYPRRRETLALRAVFGSGDVALLRSEAERRFCMLIREAGLPQPAVNTRVAGLEVDFHWPDRRLVVEVDGAAYHSTRDRFENDRGRDRTLVAAGYRVMRVTWRQLNHERLGLAVQLGRALGDVASPRAR